MDRNEMKKEQKSLLKILLHFVGSFLKSEINLK